MNRLKSTASLVRRNYERVAGRFETGVQVLEDRYTPLGRFTPGPFEGWSFLWQPAILGFVAMGLILAGCSFTNSPFKEDLANSWFFGEPSASLSPVASSTTKYILSIVLVYGGLLLLMRVWLRLAEVMKLHPGASLKSLWWMLLLWATPMIVAPPLFSKDVYSYAAQGEMTSYHISPYLFGPDTLGGGHYLPPVDQLWGNTPAPYGPFFLFLDGAMVRITDHHALWTWVGLRLLEVVAVAMIGYGVVILARGLERDPGEAFVLSAMNPLVLLTLIGGAHNDATMAGFLIVGVALAVQRHPYWALFFCSCAAAIKAPAAIGIAFVAWTWIPHASLKDKIRPVVIAGLVASATLGVFTYLAGFGFGWVGNLLSNGTVRSWAAPATGIGLAISNTMHAFGWHSLAVGSVLSVTRLLGLLTAAAFSFWLLWHAEERGWVRSLALSLILFVELGPVVQPWYLAWGLVLLAASYKGREHFWLLALSITGPFIGLPGGRQLLADLVHSNPLLIALAVAILGGVLVLPMGRWTQWSWPARELEPAT